MAFPIPHPALPRDPCTCAGHTPTAWREELAREVRLCRACQAWDDGYVLVDDIRRYLRSLWILVNCAHTVELGWYVHAAE